MLAFLCCRTLATCGLSQPKMCRRMVIYEGSESEKSYFDNFFYSIGLAGRDVGGGRRTAACVRVPTTTRCGECAWNRVCSIGFEARARGTSHTTSTIRRWRSRGIRGRRPRSVRTNTFSADHFATLSQAQMGNDIDLCRSGSGSRQTRRCACRGHGDGTKSNSDHHPMSSSSSDGGSDVGGFSAPGGSSLKQRMLAQESLCAFPLR